MDEFGIFVFGMLVAVLLVFLAIGKWYPGSGAEQVDWKPTRSYEDEPRLELEDVDQMIESQNERRRRDGRPEVTDQGVRASLAEEQRRRQSESERYRSENG